MHLRMLYSARFDSNVGGESVRQSKVPLGVRHRLMSGSPKVKDYYRRLACFMAADGNNDWNRIVLGPFK